MSSSTDKIQRVKNNKEEIVNLVGEDGYYLKLAMEKMVQEISVGDLGKIFAAANEFIQIDWINKNTTLNVKKREVDDGSNNGDGYDLITTDGILTIQSKVRSRSSIYLTQTRRMNKGGKNDHAANNTGQARYKVDEADVFIFSKPLGFDGKREISKYGNIQEWDYIAIPSKILEDPKTPGYLVTNILKSMCTQYEGRLKEILESEYQKKKSVNE